MSVELVFNELSLEPLASEVQEARQRMATLIEAVVALARLGANSNLRAAIDLRDFRLAASYQLAQWRNDPAVDRELRQYWRTIVVKSPVLRSTDLPNLHTQQREQDFLFQDLPAPGLGGAWLLDGIALSLASSEDWARSAVALTVRRLDANANLLDDLVDVRHASTAAHAEQHKNWLLEQVRLGVRDGEDLWQRRGELFPSLELCDSTRNQLQGLRSGEILLSSVTKRLFELKDYFENWDSGPFEPDAISGRVSPESPATLDKYGKERTFLCPDGVERLFSWHSRLTPGEWRVYFFPDEKSRRGIVGYIGPHLPTMKYPS